MGRACVMTASPTDDHASAERRIQELTKELSEAREQQAAASAVLRAISASRGDLRPIYDAILQSVMRLCEANIAALFLFDGQVIWGAAQQGATPEFASLFQAPFPPGRENATRRAVLEGQIIHIHDVLADPEWRPGPVHLVEKPRTSLSVPMGREGAVIGAITTWRREVRPFNERQIALIETFAEQAVIAIENTRLFEAEQAGKRELQESLEYQTATSEVLNVISRSPTELQPVLDAIAATAARLCDSIDALVWRVAGGEIRVVAEFGSPTNAITHPLTRGSVTGRAIVDRKTVHVHDLAAMVETEYPDVKEIQQRIGHRTTLATPLLSQGEALGAISVRKNHVEPFSDRQIALLQTFADQAVIAIENARLFEAEQASKRELTESLEQQTATADVLKVISRSALDVQKVLDALVESAARLCDAYDATIFQVVGDSLRLVAHHGQIRAGPVGRHTVPLVRGAIGGRAVIDRRTIQVADVLAEADEYPESQKLALQVGYRTLLCVPLVHAGEAIGVIGIRRGEVRPFTERQIELVNTFADQAVIAIENTRLFEVEQTRTKEVEAKSAELRESLEYQTATSDVLNVISRSKFELQPVLDTIVETAARLCRADMAHIRRREGDVYVHVAGYGEPPGFREYVRESKVGLGRGGIVGRVLLEKKAVQIPDVLNDSDFALSEMQRRGDFRTVLGVPLTREGVQVGIIVLLRHVVEPFTKKQIELVETFADQAVIAIENTRLFEAEQARTRELTERTQELTEALEYQTATSDVLAVISRSKFELQPVLDTIGEIASRLCAAEDVTIFLLENTDLRLVMHHGIVDTGPHDSRLPVGRGWVAGRAVADRQPIQVADLAVAGDEFPLGRMTAIRFGHRTSLGIPLLRDGVAIGCLLLRRKVVRPFDEKQISVLQTFADQAVIAIENARLFEAEQARTRELTESLEQQTATADVLKVISRSALDVQKVLDALVESAARLCNAYDATIFQVFGDGLRLVAHYGQLPTTRPVGQHTVPLVREGIGGRAIIDRRTIHVADILAELEEYPESRQRALQTGYRTALAVPLVHAGEGIGLIFIRRTEVRPFTERQIELVNTFADQAVIAIENSRLFEAVQTRTRELSDALEYQTATSDVLNVISRSKFDLQPVLDSIVETAARLCACDMATIRRREGDVYMQLAGYGLPAEYAEFSRGTSWHHAGRGSLVGRVLQEGKPVQIPDVLADTDYTLDEVQRRGGFRTVLGVPLLRGADQAGIIVLMRRVVQPFSDKQIELVTAFADQAVIAIENTRLFEEVQARTRELAKTVEDLEIASQHKNQFVANMSHELRTPLAAILGYAELIQEGFYEPQGPKSLDALTRIRSNGKHLLGLINTVLDIAKIESGQFTLNMTEYAIESVVETVRAATESLAQNKKLSIKTEVAKPLPVGLGDEQRLTQV